ncbi:MAG: hypothetical protein U0353_00445 [Sandaracinus sp.]
MKNDVRAWLLGILVAVAMLGCPPDSVYPDTAAGRYCRYQIDTCGASVVGTPSECLAGVNNNRAALPASCVSLYDAELDCLSRAACSDPMPASCASAHTATSDCAAGGMGI